MNFDILQLAAEIVHGIGALLSISDVGSLRLTCRQLNDMLESSVLQQITLDINKNNLPKSIPKLRALAAGRSPGAARSTTRLVLVCFSPGYNATAGKSESDSHEVVEGQRRLKKYLVDAIGALKRVNSVSWLTHESDDVWVQNSILKALRGLPHLQSVVLDATFLRIAPVVHRLHNVHDITIRGRSQTPISLFTDTCANISKLVARNSRVTSIHIDPGHHSGISLHSLFSDYPGNTPPLRLQHITLKNVLVKLDHITLPHLKHLKSLDLSHVGYPPKGGKHTLDSVSSLPGEIWNAFGASGIHLEEVCVTQVTTSFLQYLESYSGLRKITLAEIDGESEPEQHATRFWRKSIGKHLATLETLRVEATREGPWCLEEPTLSSIANCRSLKSLSLSLSIQNFPSNTDSAESENIVVHLIDNISCYLPRVRTLTLTPTPPSISHDERCDPPFTSHNKHVQKLIRMQVQAYVAPPSCRQLPYVVISSTEDGALDLYTPACATGDAAQFESGEWHYMRQS